MDLSGKWNDADSRMVSEEVIDDMLDSPWLVRFETRNDGARPTVIVGLVRNRSDEHIVTETFTKDIERACVNSGDVRIVATSEEEAAARREEEGDAQGLQGAAGGFGLEVDRHPELGEDVGGVIGLELVDRLDLLPAGGRGVQLGDDRERLVSVATREAIEHR